MDFPDIADKLIEMNTQVCNVTNIKEQLYLFLSVEAQGPKPCLCTENEKV